MKHTTHLKEIAYELGLSINTISRALRDCSDISDQTKQLVRQKAIEMGYIPNSVSQCIKQDTRILCAFLVNNMKNLYFSIICDNFAAALKKEKMDFSLMYQDENKVSIETIKKCISQRVDVIITFYEPTDEAISLANLYKIQIINIGNAKKDGLFSIKPNNDQGGKIAADYLLRAHSGTQYLYIGPKNFSDSTERFNSFKNEIIENNPEASIKCINCDQGNDPFNILEEIYDGYLNIFCFNDDIAYHLLDKLNSLIPNIRKIFPKLHIIGFDCISERIPGAVDITSVNFDYMSIVNEALKYIKNTRNGINNNTNVITVPTYLHTRIIIS